MTRLVIVGVACAALTACAGEVIEVNAPPPPQEYLTCEEMPTAPDLSALEAIQASNGALVYSKPETDARDAQIARYIVELRQSYFSCSNAVKRIADYYEGVRD
jgi:hypothetical protein